MPVSPSRERPAGTRARRNERAALAVADPTIDVDRALPASLRTLFETPLREALRGRSRAYAVRLEQGRREGEVVARLSCEGRRGELPLYFPNTPSLRAEDILRIVKSVLEGMGPSAP